MERKLSAIGDASCADLVQLRKLLVDAIAALAPPRARAQDRDTELMDEGAVARLRASLQTRVRHAIQGALTFWRELDLEDDQIAAALERVRQMLSRFERKYGGLQLARCSAQWQVVQALVGAAQPGEPAHSRYRTTG